MTLQKAFVMTAPMIIGSLLFFLTTKWRELRQRESLAN
jgi:hypothetical protein